MEEKSYRIRTTPGGSDNYLTLKLNQNIDYVEVLSIKINQENFYRNFTSDYGVLVGRVIANGGLGIPNANVSIFIPISTEDSENPLISSLYPFTSVNDKDSSSTPYNLLTPRDGMLVGSFPSKQQFLDNDTYLEVYEKYYKYTTKTNSSGDYMIFGVPVGINTIHMDLDLSNIGKYSFTANDLIASGISEKFFTRIGNDIYDFKQNNELETLPQIVLQNTTVNIRPLWGNKIENEIGITRYDFKVTILANPIAKFVVNFGIDIYAKGPGTVLPDRDKYIVYNNTKNGQTGNSTKDSDDTTPGYMSNVYPYVNDGNGSNFGEPEFDFIKWDKDYVKSEINSNIKIIKNKTTTNQGCMIAYLPCDQDRYITDEYGNEIKSIDDSAGIGTSCRYSIRTNVNAPTFETAYWGFVIQNIGTNGNKMAFRFESKRIYSVALRFRNNKGRAYSLKKTKNPYRVSYPNFNFVDGDWINCFLYFGRVGNDDENDKTTIPWELLWDYDGRRYNCETRFIDITDYFKILSEQVNTHYCEVGLQDSRFTSITVTKQDNPTIQDARQLPEPANSRSARVFMLGCTNNVNNFKTFKNNINI